MEYRIADTFTASLARLTGEEQKAVKTAAFDLQLNPAHPSLQFHRLDKPKDPNFWSIRVTRDVRLIVHRTGASFLLCYVDHHDAAYQWAERRKLETHPKTGAAQLVEVRETVREVVVPRYIETPAAKAAPRLFAGISDEKLLAYGVPPDWLPDVRNVTEETLLDVADHLPAEAAEALLDAALGTPPKTPEPVPAGTDPFAHPDALRRFRVMSNVEELARALEFPWEKWAIFLHPAQRQVVERRYKGPARVSGSAGTGKTIVALHRAVHLAEARPDSRVLLATFSDTLARALQAKLRALIANRPRLGERIDVYSMNAIGRRLYELHFGAVRIAPEETARRLLQEAAAAAGDQKLTLRFLRAEWEQVVDAWQLDSWEAYRDVPRLGRKTRLPEARRAVLWSVFERVRSDLGKAGLTTWSAVFTRLAGQIADAGRPPFDYVVIDEAQDIDIPQLRFLAAFGAETADRLFFSGDLGQRIFQQPFSWKSLGVDVRGRSTTLRINYRTSHQIRMQADRLLGPEVADVDGNAERRDKTVSLFNGPLPEVKIFSSAAEETAAVAEWLKARAAAGIAPHEIGVFVRSDSELERARSAVSAAKLPFQPLDKNLETISGRVAVGAMHLAKGLEFRAVAVIACDDEVIPRQERIEGVADDADLEEVYNTERHLLYVACTRARDFLLVSGTQPPSEFLDDLRGGSPRALNS